MLNDDKLLKSGFQRCWTSRTSVGRCGTLDNLARNGNGTVTVTGQNHNFYSSDFYQNHHFWSSIPLEPRI